LKPEEISKMCYRLAYKYNSPQHFEDLVSEGTLKCYELLSDNPEAHPAKLYREANRSMHDYLNFGTLGVAVPASDTARQVSRGKEVGEGSNYSEGGVEALRTALKADFSAYEEGTLSSDDNHAQDYEDRDYYAHMLSVAVTTLTKEEWDILKLRYYLSCTLDTVADMLNNTKQAVKQREDRALDKIRKELCNNL